MRVFMCVFVYIHRKLNRLNMAMGLYVCVCVYAYIMCKRVVGNG